MDWVTVKMMIVLRVAAGGGNGACCVTCSDLGEGNLCGEGLLLLRVGRRGKA